MRKMGDIGLRLRVGETRGEEGVEEICFLSLCVSLYALVEEVGRSSIAFRVEFMVLRPEITWGADVVCKLMEIDLLGRI